MKKIFLIASVSLGGVLLATGAQAQHGLTIASAKNDGAPATFKKLAQKEVSRDIPAGTASHLYIHNNVRNIEIKTWNESRIKVSTMLIYDSAATYSGDELWEKNQIYVSSAGNSIKIRSGITDFRSNNTIIPGGGMAISIRKSPQTGAVSEENPGGSGLPNRTSLIIYMPANLSLEIDNSFSGITLSSPLASLDLTMDNSHLQAGAVDTLVMHSKSSNSQFGNLKTAQVELDYGRFEAGNIGQLDIFSKYADIELGDVTRAAIQRSSNDHYEMEDVGNLSAKKDYGELRIERIRGSFALEGTNADVKLRNIASSASLISVTDQSADLRLPVSALAVFSVSFEGSYADVLANFPRSPSAPATVPGAAGDQHFTAHVGDSNQPGTRFEIKCPSCRVDFQ